jgi:hypothetical protein
MLAIACVAGVCVYYAWILSLGWQVKWHGHNDGYYGSLAQAFARGQTYLLEPPHPDMAKLADPYDPAQNGQIRLHDALYYKDRYYFYWGPVPAILGMPFKMWPGGPRGFSDVYLLMTFAGGMVLAVAAILARARERLFPSVPWWTVGIGVLAAGLANPMPYTLARPAVYEVSIFGGQFFLIWGIFFAFIGLDRRPRPWLLALAGMSWGMAVGTRVGLAPAVIAMAGLAALRLLLYRGQVDRRQRLWSLAALAAPLVAWAIGLMAYNHVRFDSPLEFGLRYQLAGINVNKLFDTLMSRRYVEPNLWRYLFEWPEVKSAFPFIEAGGRRLEFIQKHKLPFDYGMEPLIGVVWATPYVLLAGIALVALPRRNGRVDLLHERWLTLSLLIGALLAVAPDLCMMGSTMRYVVDGMPGWILLATLGLFQWIRAAQREGRPKGVLMLVVGQAWAVSVLFGLLLGMTGYSQYLERYNAPLWSEMVQRANALRP